MQLNQNFNYRNSFFVGLLCLATFSVEGNPLKSEDLTSRVVENSYSTFIPSQCYTKTQASGQVHNPCFTCHSTNQEPNFIEDAELQLLAAFRSSTRVNPWLNSFKDFSKATHKISDKAIDAYAGQSNYLDEKGWIPLRAQLETPPRIWDYDKDGKWSGYRPDVFFNFDQEGFDRDPKGVETGWRAFAYYPFPGTFWPTNGSGNDVLIRLPYAYRLNDRKQPSRVFYKLNLAIVESLVRQKNISIDTVDEKLVNWDVNGDGVLSSANEVVFRPYQEHGNNMNYVGYARQLLQANKVRIGAGLYPKGTEFFHTVRYLAPRGQEVALAPRIKELRYAVKSGWNQPYQLKNAFMAEVKELHDFPDRLKAVAGNLEQGVQNGAGWTYQGFIEDAQGALRPQTYEELISCVGCHGGISQTTDSSFAFPRRLGSEAMQGGWYHWSQKKDWLKNIPEPRWKDGTPEYAHYLKHNPTGNEFRSNQQVYQEFHDAAGRLKPEALAKLSKDIGYLLLPSPEWARQLNKAYKVIVEEQSFIYGRDPHVKPLDEVMYKEAPVDEPTGVNEAIKRKPLY